MELELSARLTQRLTPQLIQNMKLLQMNSQELSEFLLEQSQENPVFEIREEPGGAAEQLSWLSGFNPSAASERSSGEDFEESDSHLGITEIDGDGLYSWLHVQLERSAEPEPVIAMADYLAANLDESGYLDNETLDAVKDMGIPESIIKKGLKLLQSLDPAGVGALDLQECLRLQLLREDQPDTLALAIVDSHLEDLAQSKYGKISRCLSADESLVLAACVHIKKLEPYPGNKYSSARQVEYIYPDLVAEHSENGLEIHLAYDHFPKLGISSYYQSLASETDDPEVRKYLNQKFRQAQWVIGGVERRRNTILRCAEIILERQKEFFSSPTGCLMPLTRTELAEALGINVSTVCRAINGKYIQCSRGLLPMSHFFCRAFCAEENTGSISAEKAKMRIRQLLLEENKNSPLSDQKLSDLLAKEGIKISRRCVAKYRDAMGIANTAGRRRTSTDAKASIKRE